MTTRYEVSGGGVNDAFYSLRSSSGGNDPKRKVPQPYTLVSRSFMRSRAVRSSNGNLDYPFLRGGIMSSPPPFSGFDEAALQSKLMNAVKGHELNLSLTFAEPVKTLQTITSSAAAISKMVRGLATGNFQMAIRAVGALPGQKRAKEAGSKLKAGDVAGALLALRYCWEPIMNDAFAAYDAIRVAHQKPRKLYYKVSRRVDYVNEDSTSPGIFKLPAKGYRVVTYRTTLTEQITASRSYNVIDVPSILWENVPWTYVVDWFIPIGQFLENLSFFGNLQQSSVRTDFSYSEANTASGTPYPSTPIVQEIRKQDTWRSVCRTMNRTILTNAMPIALPSGKSVDKAFSTVHLQNAAALIFSAVTRAKAPADARREAESIADRNAVRKATRDQNRGIRWSKGL